MNISETSANPSDKPHESPNIKQQLFRFFFSGCSAVATDFTVYFLLLDHIGHSPAKLISFISGTLVAYILNKFWTFEAKQRSYIEVIKFCCLYCTTMGANVGTNKLVLLLFPKWILLAFLAATGVSTVLNFIGMRYWVFRYEGELG